MWSCVCFSFSLCDVGLVLATCGIVVSYEGIHVWDLRFGWLLANALKRRRPGPGDRWRLDDVFIRVRGKLHHLWRGIGQHGHVLDILVQNRRKPKSRKAVLSKAAAWLAMPAPA